jgi:hypothetical protein
MNIRKPLNNTLEFCDEYKMSDECRTFAEKHQTFADFWQHCNRSDWMLSLLEAVGYANGDKLWPYVGRLVEPQKGLSPEELNQWRENYLKSKQKFKERLEAEEGTRYAIPGSAQRSYWIGAHTWAEVESAEELKTAVASARFVAGIKEQRDDPNFPKEQVAILADQAGKEAFESTMKAQADLLREIMGNPFAPRNPDDFLNFY